MTPTLEDCPAPQPLPPPDPAHLAYLREWERMLLAWEADRLDCEPAEDGEGDAEESFR